VDPQAIGPTPHLFAERDHRTAPSAHLPWSVRLVVTERDGACLVKVPPQLFAVRDVRFVVQGIALHAYRDAEILLQAALDRVTTEVGRGRHAVPPQISRVLIAGRQSLTVSRISAATQDVVLPRN
jgi:hypothetical protein